MEGANKGRVTEVLQNSLQIASEEARKVVDKVLNGDEKALQTLSFTLVKKYGAAFEK